MSKSNLTQSNTQLRMCPRSVLLASVCIGVLFTSILSTNALSQNKPEYGPQPKEPLAQPSSPYLNLPSLISEAFRMVNESQPRPKLTNSEDASGVVLAKAITTKFQDFKNKL